MVRYTPTPEAIRSSSYSAAARHKEAHADRVDGERERPEERSGKERKREEALLERMLNCDRCQAIPASERPSMSRAKGNEWP
jgi:hypothetical protein